MIVIPENFSNNPAVDKKFINLLEFINALEEELEYPICSGIEDRLKRFKLAEMELIMQGYL